MHSRRGGCAIALTINGHKFRSNPNIGSSSYCRHYRTEENLSLPYNGDYRIPVDNTKILTHYFEGQGNLVTRLIMGILRVTIWVIGVINLLTKSP